MKYSGAGWYLERIEFGLEISYRRRFHDRNVATENIIIGYFLSKFYVTFCGCIKIIFQNGLDYSVKFTSRFFIRAFF